MTRTAKRVALGCIALAALLVVLGLVTRHLVAVTISRQVADELSETLATAVAGVEAWLAESRRTAQAAANDDRVLAARKRQLQESPPPPGPSLDEALAPYLRTGSFSGFALLDGARSVTGGTLAGASRAQRERLRRKLGTQATAARFLPPFLLSPGRPLMALALPLDASAQAPLRWLVFELPLARFTEVLKVARAGRTGETYAVDAGGNLIPHTRFDDDLREAELMRAGQRSAVLQVAVRDPGVDLTRGGHAPLPRAGQPLTRMATSLAGGQSGVDVRGYRDYRGVPVVGAWRWLPSTSFGGGFGVASELDWAEAFRSLTAIRHLFTALFGLVAVGGVALAVAGLVTERWRLRARSAERLVAELGQYTIVSKLGEGGMGSVYLATHSLLRRPTAVKLVRPDRVQPDSAARFEAEVRATSELCHPNTVAIFDYGRTPEGTLYYAMEYLEGTSFENLVRRYGPLPGGRVIHLLRQVCGSLAEAHARGLAHLDIKPGNLVTCHRGGVADMVKVLDFGLARWFRDEPASHDPEAFGTPEYTAPELFTSDGGASAQSDLYSVGAVGYFLLTGTPVFAETTIAGLCAAHLTRVPVAPSVRLGHPIDPSLEATIMSCLAKRPDQRPASAAALAWLLESSAEAGTWTPAHAEDWWQDREREEARQRDQAPDRKNDHPGFEAFSAPLTLGSASS